MARSFSQLVYEAIFSLPESAIKPACWLATLRLNETESVHLATTVHPDKSFIEHGGNTYLPFPLKVENFGDDSTGNLPSTVISLSNLDYTISRELERNDGFKGQPVELMQVWLAAGEVLPMLEISGRIQRVACATGDKLATFELGHDYLREHDLPKNAFFATFCRHKYKDARSCQYAGAKPSCTKKYHGLNGCMDHDNVQNFGGEPMLPRG